MKLPTDKTPVVRKPENVVNDFMRYQIGFSQDRPEQEPVYEHPQKRGRLMGHRAGRPISTFHLCGHGSTMEKAERMAGIKVTEPGNLTN